MPAQCLHRKLRIDVDENRENLGKTLLSAWQIDYNWDERQEIVSTKTERVQLNAISQARAQAPGLRGSRTA